MTQDESTAAIRILFQRLQCLAARDCLAYHESPGYHALIAEIRALVDARAVIFGREMTAIALTEDGNGHGWKYGL